MANLTRLRTVSILPQFARNSAAGCGISRSGRKTAAAPALPRLANLTCAVFAVPGSFFRRFPPHRVVFTARPIRRRRIRHGGSAKKLRNITGNSAMFRIPADFRQKKAAARMQQLFGNRGQIGAAVRSAPRRFCGRLRPRPPRPSVQSARQTLWAECNRAAARGQTPATQSRTMPPFSSRR